MPETNPFQDDPHIAEAWESFETDAQGASMLEPGEVRRRGDRRRRRRTVIGSASIAAAAIVGAGAILAVTTFGNEPPGVAGTPTPAPSQTATHEPTPSPSTPASDADLAQYLPTGQEIYFDVPGDLGEPMLLDGLSTASGEDRLFICEVDENLPPDQQDQLAQQPALVHARTAIFSADGVIVRAHLLQLESADAATAVADRIRGWVDDCGARATGWNGQPARGYNEDILSIDGVRVEFSVQQLRISEQESIWNGILVLTYQDRVLIVGDFVQGADYNVVGPALHQESPDLPLVGTARELDQMIERLLG